MKIIGAGTLQLAARSHVVPATFTFRGAILRPDGTIDRIRQTVTCTAAGTQASASLPVNNGELLWLFGSGPGNLRGIGGATASAYLIYGTEGPGNSLGMIFSGACSAEGGPSYRLGTQMVTTDLRTGIHIETISNPAAGAEFTWTPTHRMVEELCWVRADLVTDANVANRQPGLRITTPAGQPLIWHGANVQAASLTRNWLWSQHDIAPTATGTILHNNIPGALWCAAGILASNTVNLQAGDQWSNISIGWRGSMN